VEALVDLFEKVVVPEQLEMEALVEPRLEEVVEDRHREPFQQEHRHTRRGVAGSFRIPCKADQARRRAPD
jgi:hypothetical protein